VKRLAALLLAACATAKPAPTERVIAVTAKRFAFSPATIHLKRSEPVTLELTSLDRIHGFAVPELGIDVQVLPGQATRVQLRPEAAGTFGFHCSEFCGDGHEDMTGTLVIDP
jgi:cytochrome c oxidase subunit 2